MVADDYRCWVHIVSVEMPLLPVAALHSLAGHAEGAERIGTLGGAVSFVIWSGVAIAVAWWRLVHEDV